jgi:hypothetical protein
MPEWIRHGEHIKIESYSLSFEDPADPGCGCGFPCTKEGVVILDDMNECALENLRKCQSGEMGYTPKGVVDYSHWYYERPIIRCSCGKPLTLYDAVTNECTCGSLYNGCGQSLAPRSQWDPWGEC